MSCETLVDEVLKYCSEDYKFIVFHNNEDDEPEFWTLEKTEADATKRVIVEEKGYGGVAEWRFHYKELRFEHKTRTVAGVEKPYRVVSFI